MTHSSGFESSAIDNAAQDLGDLVPVRDWLVSHIPPRVRPPGEYAGYSNDNAVLAGYVVARVYGMPYKEYVQQEILDPLGMTYSAIGTGAPPELERSSTVGYTYSDGAFLPFPRYWAQPAMVPSAGLASSATDMARSMIAYTDDGRLWGGAHPAGGDRAADAPLPLSRRAAPLWRCEQRRGPFLFPPL